VGEGEQSMKLGFVGLGASTLACYPVPGDAVRLYEINPDVVALSSHLEPIFTYVRDSAGTVEIAIGDTRVSLERDPDQGFDVLALDAFSSESIPRIC
jgi:predicted methyltransferase